MSLPAPIAEFPWRVVIPLCLLVALGAAVLHSAAGGSMSPYADNHLIRFGVFFIMAMVMSRFPEEWARFAAIPVYIAILILLAAVEVVGQLGGGSQRWLDLGFMRLQPSELMKPGIVLILAMFFHGLPVGMIASWRALLLPLGLMGLPMAFVLLQPDLGTSLAIAFGGIVVMFLAGIPQKWFIGGAIAAVPLGIAAYFFGLQPYQQQRVITFVNPESDPQGEGYQIIQSKIAIGSGGMTGKGFGEGSQSQLDYLPEPQTDFVFATMAEEWGLMGGLFVLLVFGIILRWGMIVARDAHTRFARLLASGMTATIFFYVAINLLMVMGLAPVVGIPLPFMSHGGSSMLTNMICVGALMMVERWNMQSARSSFG
ncbi:rod shape-determining protein RodA [Aurantiacibacter gangjinensis]|uniref:Peptidoglycan glycosyltransferase MrdB n=1 Tax=Aurantiacibacter gangjinensis TaxID=502682 RepID=A0A0G9MSC1_9SPHN|nr:rod shape-determining protein RodA [Aurantiacibacter gangjinensis]